MTPTLGDIAQILEQAAPLRLAEDYDNPGWQVLPTDADTPCTGVLTCVDATEDIINEAADQGFNMVLAHHPTLFRGQKRFTGDTLVQRVIMTAIRRGIALYAMHTPVDSAPGGISRQLGRRLKLTDMEVLAPAAGEVNAGLGIIGNLPAPGLTPVALVETVKGITATPTARCSRPAAPQKKLTRIALCGGSGSEFLPRAIAAGAEAYITSDTGHHRFVDYGPEIFIIDIGHFEAEKCVNDIFYSVITEKFPNFAVQTAKVEQNPIIYL